jgi:hypothetical protein
MLIVCFDMLISLERNGIVAGVSGYWATLCLFLG